MDGNRRISVWKYFERHKKEMQIVRECIMLFLLLFVLVKMVRSREHMAYKDPMLDSLQKDLMKVHPKAKELRYFASDASFTEDKKDMYICLKDEKGHYYPRNMLMYVMLHELSHAVSKSYDDAHVGREFNENFDMLLDRATKLGIYDPKVPLIAQYCGTSA